MMRHCPYQGSASDWLTQISHPVQPIRNTTQIWVVTCHQYGTSALVQARKSTVAGDKGENNKPGIKKIAPEFNFDQEQEQNLN